MSGTTTFSPAEEARIKEAGKHVMQVMVLQCQNLYTTGMSETAFIDAVYGNITATNRTMEGVNFFKQVYTHLSENDSISDILISENGNVTLALCQKVVNNTSASSDNQLNAYSAFIEDISNIDTLAGLLLVLVIAVLIIAILIASSTPAY